MFDEDVKIASPETIKEFLCSRRKKTVSVPEEYNRESALGNTDKARDLGVALAGEVLSNLNTFALEDEDKSIDDMAVQRGVLMIFAATVAIENKITSSVVAQAAKNGFNSELEAKSPELYKAVGDTGAFSFYYLAYRRGTEVDRRIGQTFAMLCSHDGDPIFHELGEAIYCWFSSVCDKKIKSAGIE